MVDITGQYEINKTKLRWIALLIFFELIRRCLLRIGEKVRIN